MSGPQHYYGMASVQEALPTSPRRRQHLVQPPSLLTTTLGNAHISSHGVGASLQTPVSTTSLSSPFSVYQASASPYPASPGAAMRGISPMAPRTPSSFSTAYNPQQWGAMNNSGPANSRSTGATTGQSDQGLRLAPRLIGPDGMTDIDHRTELLDTNRLSIRTRRVSTTTVLSAAQSAAGKSIPADRSHLTCRYCVAWFRPIPVWYSC